MPMSSSCEKIDDAPPFLSPLLPSNIVMNPKVRRMRERRFSSRGRRCSSAAVRATVDSGLKDLFLCC